MKTIQIEIPDGYQVDSFDQASGQIKFKLKPKNVLDIKTVADILAAQGIDEDQFDASCEDLEADEKAYRILKLLAKTLNEGWMPNWSDSSESKYYAWFEMKGSSGFRFYDYDFWRTYSCVGSRLCFKSRALAEHAGKHFTAVYKDFMVID